MNVSSVLKKHHNYQWGELENTRTYYAYLDGL